MVELKDISDRPVFVNPQNVAYIVDIGGYREVHFIGTKDKYVQTRAEAAEVALALEQGR